MKNFWLVKQEPSSYSWSDFVAEGQTSWTGVRNYAARNNLRRMRKGDEVLFYHGGEDCSRAGFPLRTAHATARLPPGKSRLELLSCSKLLRSRKFPNEYDCGNGVSPTRCHSERSKGFYRRLFARRRSFNPANRK